MEKFGDWNSLEFLDFLRKRKKMRGIDWRDGEIISTTSTR